MDGYSVKRAGNGLVAPRRGLRDTAENKDKNVQYCPRLGCSGRVNYTKSARVGGMEKPRPLRPSFGSSNGKEVVGSTSLTSSGMTSARRSGKESHGKYSSNIENKLSDTSSIHKEPEVLKQMQSSTERQIQFDSAKRDTGSSKVIFAEGCSSGTSDSRPRKIFGHGPGSSNQKSPMNSSVSLLSKSISAGTRSSSSGEGNRLRNLKCNSIPDVLPCSSSPSESSISRRETVKRRNTEGESSSSSKGKKMSGASPNEGRAVRPATGISISDSRSSRSSDCSDSNRAVSVRTRRSMNVSTRLRGPIQDSLQTKSSGLSQNIPQPETPTLDMPSSSSQFFTGSSSSDYSAYSLPGNDDDDDEDEDDDLSGVVPFTSAEIGINRFMNREALQRYNMDGVAQVLLALERVEQDEELSYERLLALETNLFLSGLNFYDQHRDMRLDIDDMSYEELLALEERIGSVSTALPEEELSKCLRRSIYQGMASETETLEADGDGDDVRCSICQEEYVIGDEIGNLGCEHGYHMECIKQWFKLKNWCPICKAAADSSKTLS
ncbi:probable E3 ubiquitin-protein ligase RHG1A [Solanum dulcamara]|uniref:probable E3 ubiquitin-protein ligase RHG1A n=1 Tax=Solanum dulcamara TaxID=45834 RepID=UPI0024855C17|nr:probable E3 ubiquitin-protein ligase RHG1A [Solanum dulcamara]